MENACTVKLRHVIVYVESVILG